MVCFVESTTLFVGFKMKLLFRARNSFLKSVFVVVVSDLFYEVGIFNLV